MRAAWVCVCRTTCLAKSCMTVTMCGRPPAPPVRIRYVLPPGDSPDASGQIMKMPVQAVTLEVFRAAVSISRRFGLSYWDGAILAILAAARSLGCDAVYSEDLSSEQDYDGLRVINPFPEAPIAQ